MKKIAIVTTHPIQYNAPFFKLLTEREKVSPKVFYTWPQAIEGFDDPDFGKQVKWDIPLLEGYNWEAVENISRNPTSKRSSGINCPSLVKQIETFHPDAILVYGWNLKSHFKVMRFFKGKISVWFFGDSTLLDEQAGIKKILRRIWLTWIYRYIDKAFYVGTNNKAYFKAHGLKNDQLVFFPHAIDNKRFRDNDKLGYKVKAKQWRRELGYEENDFVVLFAGKFEPRKNLDILMNAIIKLNQESVQKYEQPNQKSIKLLLFGNGPLEKELKQMAIGHDFIKIMPFQNQSLMPVLYRLGDIFCLPSKSETWGLVVNEAMACGLPVLVSEKVGCAVNLVEHDETGLTFLSGDIKELSNALGRIRTKDMKDLEIKVLEKISSWSFEKKCTAIEQSLLTNHGC